MTSLDRHEDFVSLQIIQSWPFLLAILSSLTSSALYQSIKMRTYASLQSLFAMLVFFLALRYASSAYSALPPQPVNPSCSSIDQPNPIASTYPNNATGTLNGTIAVIPIPISLARQLIPSQYRILEHAYRALLPDFPKGMYPAMMQAMHDHDVQLFAFGFKLDDFSVG